MERGSLGVWQPNTWAPKFKVASHDFAPNQVRGKEILFIELATWSMFKLQIKGLPNGFYDLLTTLVGL